MLKWCQQMAGRRCSQFLAAQSKQDPPLTRSLVQVVRRFREKLGTLLPGRDAYRGGDHSRLTTVVCTSLKDAVHRC